LEDPLELERSTDEEFKKFIEQELVKIITDLPSPANVQAYGRVHNGDARALLCMVFGQLTARDSVRDLMLSLEAHQSKYYHLGFGPTVSRRNLGTANERRNCKIFEEFAYVLIAEARRSCYREDFEIEVDGNVYALDSTTIDLCLSVFWWAEFRKHKGGIKIYTLFDIKTSIVLVLLVFALQNLKM